MNKKNIISLGMAILISILLFITNKSYNKSSEVNLYYQVYLNGEKLGVIDNQDQLYKLIDKNQVAIKYQYDVLTVYPPTNLKIIKTNTYSNNLDSIEDIYQKIEDKDNFTIKGYIITIKGDENSYTINVLDKEIFYNAAKRFVRAFLDENEYEKYINNNQSEIIDTGRIIEGMRFLEQISIQEGYINVNDKIYTDETELTQFLLFGDNPDTKTYTVKLGDTIESVSENNQLNPEEFLVANTAYKSASTLLRVGDKVNVTLIQPQLTFIYDLYDVHDEVVVFEKETKKDNTKNVGYSAITTPGRNGLNRIKEHYTVTNGVRPQGSDPEIIVLKEPQNQITTVGTKSNSFGYIPPNPVDITGDWAWPTNKGYVITSPYAWRNGKFHSGLDISGAGNLGSPIYAAGAGRVIYVYNECPNVGKGYGDKCGGEMGNSIVIDHENGYFTRYAHLTNKINVSVGDYVSRGQNIAYMGSSGSSTGPHLHFAVSQGTQYNYFNPWLLYQ